MSTVSAYSKKNGQKRDEHLHRPILDAVQFHKTPAFKHTLKRAAKVPGLDEQMARSMLNPPPVELP
jgi:hypothetical protein